MLKMTRNIDDVPYSFTRTENGDWHVVRLDKMTDRFYRNYRVQVNEFGRPTKCSCPDCFYRSAWCKHLKVIEAIYRELKAEQTVEEVVESKAVQGALFPESHLEDRR
jgi:hypothetical protein